MSKGHSYIAGFILFLVTTICLSYIFGILSECKFGKSVWTYVSVHALYNVIGVIIMNMISASNYKYLDESGYLLVTAVLVVTVGTSLIARRVGHKV